MLLEKDGEPFGGVLEFGGEGEGAGRNFAAVAGDGERDGGEIRGIVGANEVDGGSALAVDPLAVYGIEGPGAVEGESAGGGDAGFAERDGIERFDGVEADVGKFGSGEGHGKSLAGRGEEEEVRE